MVDTGLLDNFLARGVLGPSLFARMILYTQRHGTKYSLNMYVTFLVRPGSRLATLVLQEKRDNMYIGTSVSR
jgi:hypothetical protein